MKKSKNNLQDVCQVPGNSLGGQQSVLDRNIKGQRGRKVAWTGVILNISESNRAQNKGYEGLHEGCNHASEDYGKNRESSKFQNFQTKLLNY